ncbi:MAG TPA: FMN-binding protein, partial [Tissierellaceae bacterium]
MKKFTSILLALLLILGTIAGCTKTETTTSPQQTDTNSNENTPALIDGDYEVEVKGHNGPMKIKVSFSNNTITNVEIIEHSETKVLSDPAIEGIPADIVKYNSIAIDSVAGATITSAAIKSAVRTAIEKAGGNPNDFNNEINKSTPEHKVIETDVVVVGAGAAGISAALKADELGSKVILLEKTGQIGGEIVVSGGNQVVMGSELQKQAGVTNDT